MLCLHRIQIALVDGVFECFAHTLELLRQPSRVLECQVSRADFIPEYVDVLAELVDGVYGMLDVEEELTELVVDQAGDCLYFKYIGVVGAYVQNA